MNSRQAAHEEIAFAFGFPDYYGKNWDAFDDCFGEYVEQHDGELVAIIWDHLDEAASAASATVAEVGWALLDCSFNSKPPLAPGSSWGISMDVFAIGDNDDFDRTTVE
jgi:RNAse (barnase) inhibitor barstar